MNKNRILISVLAGFTLLSTGLIQTNKALAWFGAGKTPGWTPTTTGLSGEIPLASYKFAPDFYRVGDVVSPSVTGYNNSGVGVTSHYFFAVDRVIESPKRTNVTDGTPSIPGINENDLNTNHQNNNDVQSQVALLNLGSFTFPANGSLSFSASYKTTDTGYYQFDFIDIDPSNYQPGHILAAGYFRVLPALATPTPSPSATPVPTSTPSPTSNPSSTNVGQQSQMGIDGQICSGQNFNAWSILTLDGNPIKGVQIKFVYNNEAKYAKTEANGRAGVAYGYANDSKVDVIPENGYPSQSQDIKKTSDANCQTTNNPQSSSGKVLGASTMATTGTTEETAVNLVGMLGMTLITVSLLNMSSKRRV